MAAVKWEGTEKVMGTGAVTLSLNLMMSYKILCRLRKKCPQPENAVCLYFQKLQPFIPTYPLKD